MTFYSGNNNIVIFRCREQEQELETQIPWLQQKSHLESNNNSVNPLKLNSNLYSKITNEESNKESINDCVKSVIWKEKLKRR